MIPHFKNKTTLLEDYYLLPVLLLVIIYYCFESLISILGFPGPFTVSRGFLIAFPSVVAVVCFLILVFHVTKRNQLLRWIQNFLDNPWGQKTQKALLPVSWLVLIVVSFLSPLSLGRWSAIYERLVPIFILLFVLVSCFWIYGLFITRRSQIADPTLKHQYSVKTGLLLGLLIGIIWVIISVSGKGIGNGTQYWGKTGVPILNWQVGLSWLIVFVLAYFYKPRSKWFLRNRDLIVFCLLWISAFVAWQSVPVPASRFTTAAYPPNFTNYPYSDAADYAIQAELILSGNGFSEGFVDKPLHLTFLACLNWLAGSDFSKMILFQKAILAIIPGLVFLIGLRLYNRPAGALAGMLVLFIQMNNLAAAPNIQSTNVSMTMSEPWTSLILLFCCLALMSWWEKPNGSLWLPALAGGVIGLAVLVRLNSITLFLLVATVWILFSGINKKKTWTNLLIFSLFFVGTLIPWGIRNQIVFDNAFKSYLSKAHGVLYKHRIKPVLEERTIIELSPSQLNFAKTPGMETEKDSSDQYAILFDQMLHSGFHNLITVSLALPVSPNHTGLDQTIRLPYWDQEWDGKLVEGGWIILSTSLLMLVIGFSRAWKERHIVSLIPGLILMSYLGANTISMVSGGRYIVPVDWVLPLHYAVGVWTLTVLVFGLNDTEKSNSNLDLHEKTSSIGLNKIYTIGVGFIIFFACLPAVLGLTLPLEKVELSKMDVLEELKTSRIVLPSSITWDMLDEFAENEDSSFTKVKAMFPRWMKTGEGDTGGAGSAFSPLPYDHLSFIAIDGTGRKFHVVLPINEQIQYLPDASEVFLVGCKGENFFDAIAVIVSKTRSIFYSRPYIAKLTCPLQQP